MIIKKKLLITISTILVMVIFNNHFCLVSINFRPYSDSSFFRLMTYNTNGVAGDYKDDNFVDLFLHSIDSISPQILVLQEMHREYSTTVCSELQKRYSYNSLSQIASRKKSDRFAACLFSKYPIRSFYRYAFEKQELDSIYNECAIPDSIKRPFNADIYNAVLDIDSHETLVVCCYLKSNEYSKLRNEHNDKWIDGLDDYLGAYNRGSTIRSLESKMIRDSIAKYSLPTIVCGDMNDFQCSPAVKTMMGDNMKNVWWERGLGYGMTYDKYHLKIRIDHILISNEFEAERVDVPHLPFSDHYPIVADLRFISK